MKKRRLLVRSAAVLPSALLLSVLRAGEPPTSLPLWPEGVPGLRADAAPERTLPTGRITGVHTPTLLVYPAPADRACGTAAIICPGGAYLRLAVGPEGADVARWLNSLGVTAFVLKYRLSEYGQPAPLRDVARAVRLVRDGAARFGVRPDRIGVVGFSAGGHVAACAATLYDAPEARMDTALDRLSARPDFAVLVYPVISMQEGLAHAESRQALLGAHPSPELVRHWSADLQVAPGNPPVFLVHSLGDKSVPAEHSLRFAQALRAAGVPVELHLFEKGSHAFGLGTGAGPVDQWPHLCENWLRAHGWLDAPAP